MKKFKSGDRVRLISGSDEMVVCSVFGFTHVACEWVGKEGKTYKNSFRPEYLELIAVQEEKPDSKKTFDDQLRID